VAAKQNRAETRKFRGYRAGGRRGHRRRSWPVRPAHPDNCRSRLALDARGVDDIEVRQGGGEPVTPVAMCERRDGSTDPWQETETNASDGYRGIVKQGYAGGGGGPDVGT
jgi:hypothetical protein